MTIIQPVNDEAPVGKGAIYLRLLVADPFALVSAVVILVIVLLAVGGQLLTGNGDEAPNFAMRNIAPFTLQHGPWFVLGSDSLGRSILSRLIVGTQLTVLIAFSATAVAALVGCTLGVIAGYRGGWVEMLIMRLIDTVMSFPSLLTAVIVLFVFGPRPEYIVAVLAVTRIPVYTRVTRAEVMELRESVFVEASRVLGGGALHIVVRHILPMTIPTLLTVMTIDFAVVMLAESGLSFIGIGIQPPAVTWGLMVASGRNYLGTAWWISFFPGVMIILTALSANILSNWLRLVLDPRQRWRLKTGGGKDA